MPYILRSLFITALLAVSALFVSCCSEPNIIQAGGAYSKSPNGRWRAEIYDAYNETNEKYYAVIYVWDLAKYPSLGDESNIFQTYWGKEPEIKFVFPQTFQARDNKCDIIWNADSTEFSIEFDLTDPNQHEGNAARLFVYNLKTHLFSLERRKG